MLTVRCIEIGEALALTAPLPAGAQGYAEAPKNDGVRAQRLAGLRLLSEVYREATGTPLPSLVFGERGKPSSAGGELSFNLTHAGRLVAVALDSSELGIDLEAYGDTDEGRAERLLLLFNDRERALVAASPDARRAAVEIFVRKEALSKKDGRGLPVLRRMDGSQPPRYEARPRDAEGREYYLCVY